MKREIRIYYIQKKTLYLFLSIMAIFVAVSQWIWFSTLTLNIHTDPKSRIIVLDPGHGGVDGGTNKDGILEKDINLAVSMKCKALLEEKGYVVVMTREEDISLDHLNQSSQSRHQRDLNARVDIINSSQALLFLSIHINCNYNRPATDGSIIFYNDRFEENKILAYAIQRKLNALEINGKTRTVHDPVKGNYYILGYAKIPGVIVEAAFMSNEAERRLLLQDTFQEQLAEAIAEGTNQYVNEPVEVFSPLNSRLSNLP